MVTILVFCLEERRWEPERVFWERQDREGIVVVIVVGKGIDGEVRQVREKEDR